MARIQDFFAAEVKITGDFQHFSLLKPYDQLKARERLNKMIREIKRHIDNVQSVTLSIPDICEFCGSNWELDEGLPACCTKAQEEAREEMKETDGT